MEAAARNHSAQDDEKALQSGVEEAPTRIELVYEALQASA
jgi:hypothetical protein